ncbi:unnamed protein product [Bathycoccus prasinos]
MEVDGEYALVKAFGKATQTPIPQDRDVAIALMKTKPLYNFWKEHGIANPKVHERFTKISGNIPVPTQRDPTLTNGGGRRSLQAGRGGKSSRKVRRVDNSNEDLRFARHNAVRDEARFRERAMQQQENQMVMDYLRITPDGPEKGEVHALLTKRMKAMLGASNEVPAAPVPAAPVPAAPAAPAPAPAEEIVISDGEDENGDVLA